MFKLIHHDDLKLEKSTFTGCCYNLGNPKAATDNVKGNYNKCLNAFTMYWEATLHASYQRFVQEGTLADTVMEKGKEGKDVFLPYFK